MAEAAPVRAERIPSAGAPVVLSELRQVGAERSWAIVGAAAALVAVVLLLVALVVLS